MRAVPPHGRVAGGSAASGRGASRADGLKDGGHGRAGRTAVSRRCRACKTRGATMGRGPCRVERFSASICRARCRCGRASAAARRGRILTRKIAVGLSRTASRRPCEAAS